MNNQRLVQQDAAKLAEQISSIVGAGNILTDADDLRFYSTDVYRQADEIAIFVVRPGSVEELQAVVRCCAAAGSPLVTRGGGASYTDGYLPVRKNTVCIDTCRLTRIDINEQDMYVTAEAGVTWAALNEALKEKDLRTPFWGPFSGLAATVGGSMSSYAVNYGSGLYGVSAESLTSLDVVLASGELLSTGSAGGKGGSAFYRYYGPDLTGIFVGDAGAFGIKARVSMRLMRRPPAFQACSFGFKNGEQALTAMIEIAKLGVVSQNFGLDPRQQKTALTSMQSANPLDAAKSVFFSARNPLDGAIQVAKMGFAGRNFLKNAVYSAHFSVEGLSDSEARAKIAVVRAVGRQYGAEVANSIPTYFNAEPFMELLPILGPNGERWKPTHGIIPFSNLLKHHKDFEALAAEYQERMEAAGVQLTRMLMFFSTNGFIYEPTFLWKDSRTIYHERVYPASLLPAVPVHEDNPQGRALVSEIKKRIGEICIQNGACHMQIGKDYPYLETRKPEMAGLVRKIKADLDPAGIMNPGALGLD
ncbi:MAG: FAD-binding oxidoreductase [Gammaproteobacteria bacterium]|nr:MAG: FAD-binding oxidoreductase [Gammaproteobacteria bacterium]